MSSKRIRERLSAADRMGVWAFTPSSFSVLLGGVERRYLRLLMKRLADTGVLVRAVRGVYVNPLARSLPADVRASLIPFIRPREFTYISLESRLSELGIISQVTNTLTCMTTGETGYFATPWGNIDLVHTERDLEDTIAGEVFWRPDSPLPVASAKRAIMDLRRARRSTDLVDEETLRDILEEEEEAMIGRFHP